MVYDSTNGNLTGSVYDSNTENIEVYVVNPKARDGAALFMAMFPTLMEDDEFEEYFGKYRDAYDSGFTDMTQAIEYAGYLCDNVYRRIKDETSPANVKVNLDAAGNLMRISHTHLDSGTYAPKEVVAGEFTIFAKLGKPKTVGKAKKVIAQADFVGKFMLSARKLNVQESLLVPKLPEWYIVPEEVLDICKHAQGTTGRPMQMRNFLLRGPAGTGKTMGAKAIAAGLGLPYMKYTCSAGTEIYDFIGQIFPDSESKSGNSELDKEREQLKKMRGITYANVSKLMGLPDLEDMDYDPAGVYQMLTGVENLSATSQDCMSVVMERVTEKVKALSKQNESDGNKGQSFSYIETDFIKALKYGYVVEIQEPTTIMQPGVLVGLNSLLEQEGSITLPTGEIIQRHPDAVVVVTTNVTYEGCRGMNQSIIDRMSLLRDIELPSPEVMAERAMSVTGETDEYKVSQMVQVTPPWGQSSYYVQCPCCDDNPKSKHLNINLKKDVFRCPKCGVSGGVLDLYALFSGVARDKAYRDYCHPFPIFLRNMFLSEHGQVQKDILYRETVKLTPNTLKTDKNSGRHYRSHKNPRKLF